MNQILYVLWMISLVACPVLISAYWLVSTICMAKQARWKAFGLMCLLWGGFAALLLCMALPMTQAWLLLILTAIGLWIQEAPLIFGVLAGILCIVDIKIFLWLWNRRRQRTEPPTPSVFKNLLWAAVVMLGWLCLLCVHGGKC